VKQRKIILIISFISVIVLLILALFFISSNQQKSFQPVLPVPELSSLPEAEPAVQPKTESYQQTLPEPLPPRIPLMVWPVRIRIPALGLDAAIEDTGYDSSHTMEIVPSADIISWLRESSIPSNDGNAILGGHNKWKGKICPLYELDTLEIGEEMEIEYEDGLCLKFKLESVFVYALATAPAGLIMDVGGEARVTIITCKPPFNPRIGTSDNRIVAIFKEASIFTIPDPPIEPFPPMQLK